MKRKNFYLVSDGKLRRKENTIYFENEDGKRAIPINAIHTIYALGSLSITSKAISLLSKEGICIHFFNRSGFYVGSFYPRESLISGDLTIKQAEHYLDREKRLFLAKSMVEGAILNMVKVLSYYKLEDERKDVEDTLNQLHTSDSIQEIMGAEALAKNTYYGCFDKILKKYRFEKRTRNPPGNEINAMISFGNALLYSTVLSELYHTQLNPTISYLHEPSERRFSLSLDISEIFKPVIVDRTVFQLANRKVMSESDFRSELNGVLLSDSGKRKFLEAYNSKLETTVKHRDLGRKVSYQRLIRLECYKLVKHLLGIEPYKPFVAWW